jgi:hypothetical protein
MARVRAVDGEADAPQKAVFEGVHEAVHLQPVPPLPRAAHDRRPAHVRDLLDHVELAEARGTLVGGSRALEQLVMAQRDVFDVAQPVVGEPRRSPRGGRVLAGASLVPDHHDELDLRHLD